LFFVSTLLQILKQSSSRIDLTIEIK
jgi:hypothetical protein